MESILEIALMSRETRHDIRELKADFHDHVEDGHSKTAPKKVAAKKTAVTAKGLKKK